MRFLEDRILLEIIWSRMINALDEAATVLYRTAFSPVVRESNDFACIVTDARGLALAQSAASMPSFTWTLPRTVRHFLRYLPAEKLSPGDALVLNDPWMGTGHLNDICIMVPIFRDGRIVGYAASAAHSPDIGGRLRSFDNREIFEEGLQIPPMKIHLAGEANQTAYSFIRQNVRMPDEVIGDIEAQIAANNLAGMRVLELMSDFRLESLDDVGDAIHTISENAMRDAIRNIGSGTYRERLSLTELVDHPVELEAALTIDSDKAEIVVDYEGTSRQVAAPCNSVLAFTTAYTIYALRCVLAPHLPNNEGCYRPIEVRAPEGSVLNPTYPAATSVRYWFAHRLPTMIFDALGQVVPERVRAQSGQPPWVLLISGRRKDGRNFFLTDFEFGGLGAASGDDGPSCIAFPASAANSPIEIQEQVAPIIFRRRELRPDSGGTGQWRGGHGQVVEIEIGAVSSARMSIYPSLVSGAARGLRGGGDGASGMVLLNGKTFNFQVPVELSEGDRLQMHLPGGGGYGRADDRSVEADAFDMKAGLIARTAAGAMQ